MKSLFETLAALSAGAALLSGCGGAPAPVNAAEVPAATEVKPSGAPQAAAASPTESKTSGATAGATTPAANTATAAAAPAPAGTAAPAAKPAAKARKVGAKKVDANGSCGPGTCT